MVVRVDKNRRKAPTTVDLVSPNGTQITVSAERADALMNRPPVQRGDGRWFKYAPEGESNEVDKVNANAEVVKSLKDKEAGAK